jgi:hypothetical protein
MFTGAYVKSLRDADIKTLSILAEHQEGISLKSIYNQTDAISGKSYVNTAVRMRKLITKKDAIKRIHLYFITPEGIEAIKRFKQPIESATLGGKKDLHLTKPAPLKPPQEAPSPQALQAQRMHSIKLIARLYRTSYDRWEAIAQTLRIEYTVVRNVSPKQYMVEWNGVKIKLTRHKLIAFAKEITAPIEIRASELESKAIRDNMQQIEGFLDKTNLRCQRDLNGALIIRIKPWEIAFTKNELARRLTQKGGFIALAFNRHTGKATLWADRSFTTELEAGEEDMHEKMREWGQAIQDGIIKPYEDELATRRQLQQVATAINALAQSQADFAAETTKLGSAALTTQNQLNYYSKQIEAHARAIVKLNKVLDKLDKVLSQRKLSDFE